MRNVVKKNSGQKMRKQFLKREGCKNKSAAFLETDVPTILATIRKTTTTPQF